MLAQIKKILERPLALIHIFKTVIAIALSMFVAHWSNTNHAVWIIISTVLVMVTSRSVGVHIERSLLRLVGTLVGSACGVSIILLPTPWWINIFAVMVLSALFLLVNEMKSAWQYGVILCLVTLAIVVTTPQPSVSIAMARSIDIVIGIFIALGVSILVKPISSYRLFKDFYQQAWSVIAGYTTLVMMQKHAKGRYRDARDYEMKIQSLLSSQHHLLSVIDARYKPLMRERQRQQNKLQFSIFRYLSVIEVILRRYYVEQPEVTCVFEDWHEVAGRLNQCLIALSKDKLTKLEVEDYQSAVSQLAQETLVAVSNAQNSQDAAVAVRFSLYRIGVVLEMLC